MKNYGLVHPRMLCELTPNFYPSDCTINSVTIEINSFGDEILTQVEVLVDVPCRIAPSNSREVLGPQQEFVERAGQVTLAGYYPQIDSDMIPVM